MPGAARISFFIYFVEKTWRSSLCEELASSSQSGAPAPVMQSNILSGRSAPHWSTTTPAGAAASEKPRSPSDPGGPQGSRCRKAACGPRQQTASGSNNDTWRDGSYFSKEALSIDVARSRATYRAIAITLVPFRHCDFDSRSSTCKRARACWFVTRLCYRDHERQSRYRSDP